MNTTTTRVHPSFNILYRQQHQQTARQDLIQLTVNSKIFARRESRYTHATSASPLSLPVTVYSKPKLGQLYFCLSVQASKKFVNFTVRPLGWLDVEVAKDFLGRASVMSA
jgi:hypothetical protein